MPPTRLTYIGPKGLAEMTKDIVHQIFFPPPPARLGNMPKKQKKVEEVGGGGAKFSNGELA